MIARFFIALPFDLFMTEEVEGGIQGEDFKVGDTPVRVMIPIAWRYAERPDLTGTVHEIAFEWIPKLKEPVFNDSCKYAGKNVARVNVLVFDLISDSFDRDKNSLLNHGPFIRAGFEIANQFLARLRTYARLPQIRPLIPTHDPWQLEFRDDNNDLLPRETERLRIARSSAVNIGVYAFSSDSIKTVSERWNTSEPYMWDHLLLDANALWPNIGSAVVTAFTALETFITWALEVLQSSTHTFKDDAWEWIMNRNDWSKSPSVEEQYDNLLSVFTAKSLKDNQKLWMVFKDLKKARNSLVHEGLATLGNGEIVDAPKAKRLIDGAAEIIAWVEQLLPEEHRRHGSGAVTPVARRFATEEQAFHYEFGEHRLSDAP